MAEGMSNEQLARLRQTHQHDLTVLDLLDEIDRMLLVNERFATAYEDIRRRLEIAVTAFEVLRSSIDPTTADDSVMRALAMLQQATGDQ
jgi:hypothetical protein